jgi:hypothetical protein
MNRKGSICLKLTLIALLLGYPIAGMAQNFMRIFPAGDKPGAVLFFSLVILSTFIALAVHELGHLIAGLAQGFRFELFVVGLLGIKRSEGRVKIYLNKNAGMMGGVAATIPVVQSPENKKKFAIMILAGPLASLLYSVVSFVLLGIATSGAARGFWLVSGACSLALFFATTLPRKTGMFFTDRARFQRLISKGKASENEDALLSLITQNMIDSSSKNISLEKARLLRTDDDAIVRFWGCYYEYYYFKDNSHTEEAAKAREELLALKSSVPPSLWKILKIE